MNSSSLKRNPFNPHSFSKLKQQIIALLGMLSFFASLSFLLHYLERQSAVKTYVSSGEREIIQLDEIQGNLATKETKASAVFILKRSGE